MQSNSTFESVSMRKPGRTREEVIQLKSPILLELGTNVGYGELMINYGKKLGQNILFLSS